MLTMSLPSNIQPMLAVAMEPFDDPDYIYELKWDGIRCLGFIDGGTRLQSRNLKTLNESYPDLTGLHEVLSAAAPCVVDGEIIALRNGRPSFLELQKRHNARRPETIQRVIKAIPVVYMIFDLLYYRGESITQQPFRYRRALLVESLKTADPYLLTETVSGRGKDYFAAAAALGLEGVVGKGSQSPYLPGKRTRHWVKFKNVHVASFLICGYTVNPTTRGELSALVLGAYQCGKLVEFGMAGTGFSQNELAYLQSELTKLKTEICPFTGKPLRLPNRHWVEPEMICDVQYLELTDQGVLRHPLYKGLRGDLAPKECTFPPDLD